VDIREQSVVHLNLPYQLQQTYLRSGSYIGTLHVRVLNDLRCPETCAQQVQILTFYTAGDDFEFQVPSNSALVGSGIYTPQSKSGSETLVNNGIGDSQIKTASTMHSETCIGEHFLSIKQLLNRNCQSQPIGTNTWAGKSYRIYPYFITGITSAPVTGTVVLPSFAADSFSFLAPMFAYFRGSSRILIQGTTSKVISGMDPMFFKNYSTSDYLFNSTFFSSFGRNSGVSVNSSFDKQPFNTMQYSNENVTAGFQQGTYQNQYPVTFTHVWQGELQDFPSNDTSPATAVAFNTIDDTAFGVNTTLWRSFTDEFQLSFFIACPPVFIQNTVL